jgi:hypothetical protein
METKDSVMTMRSVSIEIQRAARLLPQAVCLMFVSLKNR